MARTRLQEKHARITRRKIVAVARRAFARRGYSRTSIAEIARQSRVTEGAVFHHFASKRDLLQEVFEEIEHETVAEIERLIGEEPNSAKRFVAAVDAFLAIGARPEKRQIAFRDAPSILGWEAVREILSRHALPMVMKLVAELVDPARAELVAEMLLALVAEAAMTIDRSSKPAEARRQLKSILIEFVLPTVRPSS